MAADAVGLLDALAIQQAHIVGIHNLEKITAPTVVLQGQADSLVPGASTEDIVARVPGAELRLIPGLGHDLPVALVSVFADAITAAAERATH